MPPYAWTLPINVDSVQTFLWKTAKSFKDLVNSPKPLGTLDYEKCKDYLTIILNIYIQSSVNVKKISVRFKQVMDWWDNWLLIYHTIWDSSFTWLKMESKSQLFTCKSKNVIFYNFKIWYIYLLNSGELPQFCST